MRKAFGLAIALTLAVALPAVAEQTHGMIKSVDPADRSFTLADGTRLWVDEAQIADLQPGDDVQAMYQTQGDKKVVTDLYRNAIGPDGRGITYYGTGYAHSPIDPIQAGD
jgi:Cu/Ag efflux protein CusF